MAKLPKHARTQRLNQQTNWEKYELILLLYWYMGIVMAQESLSYVLARKK